MEKRSLVRACIAATLVSVPSLTHAAGFALIEQGVKGLGNAYAGGAAASEDPTTVFFNPAGMTRLDGRQVTVAGHLIQPSMKFSDSGSHISAALGGAALTGGDGGDAGEFAFVPNLYYTHALGGGHYFGIGVNAPFGLATEYDSDWKGRYQAVRSAITTININPSYAFRVTEKLSLGVGISAQYMEAELTQAVDFSVACLGTFGGAACAGAGLATPQSPATDGFSSNTADSWGWGYNLGILFEFTPSTRVGLAYRSKIEQKLEGDGDFTLPTAVSTGVTAPAIGLRTVFADSAINANVTLPETISASAYHQFGNRWAIMGDITYTRWSRIPELRIDFANAAKSDGVETLNWENTWRYSLGATYFVNDQWTLRVGAAYDETPVPDAQSRTARLPDNDRKWLALGGSYVASKAVSMDFGYAHLFISDSSINHTGALGDVLIGTYENATDILSAQLNWKF